MIGLWDDSSVDHAILPMCWKNGDNPSSYQWGSIPVFQKASPITATLMPNDPVHGVEYSNGELLFQQIEGRHVQTTKTVTLTNTNKFTVTMFINVLTGYSIHTQYYVGVGTNLGTRLTAWLSPDASSALLLPLPIPPDGAVFSAIPYKIGLHTMRIVKNAGEWLYYHNGSLLGSTTYTKGDITFSNQLQLGNDGVGTTSEQDIGMRTQGYIFRNSAMSVDELQAEYNLGPDLGGLAGYDNGDGSMSLTVFHKKQRLFFFF